MPDDGMHRAPWAKCRNCGTRRPPYALDEQGLCMRDQDGFRWCNKVTDSIGLVLTGEDVVELVPNAEPIDSDRAGTIPNAEAEPKVEATRKGHGRSAGRKTSR